MAGGSLARERADGKAKRRIDIGAAAGHDGKNERGENGMKKAAMAVLAAAVLAAVLASGCGKAGTGAVEETAAALAQVAKTPEEEAKEAAEGALEALKAGRMDEVYAALPASWQDDMSRVAAAFAGKVDPELAEAVSGAVTALGGVLEAQAGHLAEWAMDAGAGRGWAQMEALEGKSAEELEEGIKAAGAMLKESAGWLSVEKLAQGDLAGVLGSLPPMPVFFKTALAEDVMPVAVRVSTEGAEDGAVALELGDDAAGWERVVWEKVEGRWVPSELAGEWAEDIAKAMASAAAFEIPPETAAMAKGMLPALVRAMEAWKGAASAQELQAQAVGTLAMLGMLGIPLD